MKAFDASARFYDLIYRDKDYEAEAAYALGLMARGRGEISTLLELGSGTGGHARHWAGRGISVFCVDQNPHMLAELEERRRGLDPDARSRIKSVRSDIRDLDLGQKFQAAASLFHVFSYLRTDEDILAGLVSATRHLEPGGVLLFDCWHGPAVLAQRPETRTRTVEDERTKITRLAEPVMDEAREMVEVRFTYEARDKATGRTHTDRESHFMHYLFPEKLAPLMVRAGLEHVQSGAWMEDGPPHAGNWSAWHLCRKTERA